MATNQKTTEHHPDTGTDECPVCQTVKAAMDVVMDAMLQLAVGFPIPEVVTPEHRARVERLHVITQVLDYCYTQALQVTDKDQLMELICDGLGQHGILAMARPHGVVPSIDTKH